PRLIVGLGGTANMDAGAGLLDALDALPAPTTVLCDVQTTLYDAPRLFGPQKGATPEQVDELEARFRALRELEPYAGLPGSGAAGGLGAALAPLPESERLVERSLPLLEALDDLLQLGLGLLERRLRLVHGATSSTRAPNEPSATRTSTCMPGATSALAVTTFDSVRTIAYPR